MIGPTWLLGAQAILYRDGVLYRIPSGTGDPIELIIGGGTETDPVFLASPAGSITTTQKTNWNSAYSWGNHALAGYLTTESDTLNSVTTRGNTTLNTITVGGIIATGVTSTIYAGPGTRLRTETNNLVFERVSSSGFMKFYINQTTLSATAKSYIGYDNATLNVVLSNEYSTGNLELRTQDLVRQVIFASGNVFIGSTTPTDSGYKLDVIGSVKVDTVLHMGNATDARVVIRGLSTDGSIYIGGSSLTTTLAALRNVIISTVGSYSTLTGINNTFYGRAAGLNVTNGASNVFIGSNAGAGITTGTRNVFVTSSDAGNLPSSLSYSVHLVAGNGYRSNDASTIPSATHAFIGGGFNTGFAIKDFYFGQMPFTADAGSGLVNIVFYAPSGSGTDIGGANFTIAGGRGTGTGTPGDVIISTSTSLTTGTTLQTLTQRLKIAAGTGIITISNLAGTGDRMVVANSTGVLSTQAIPSGGGVWGTITGTLSSQTDLQNALNAKQNTLTVDVNEGLELTGSSLGTIYNTLIADGVNSVAVGGATAQPASFWKSKTLVQTLDTILFPTLSAFISTVKSASLAVNGISGTIEIGQTVSRTLTTTFVRGTITNGDGTVNANPLVGAASNYAFSGTGISLTNQAGNTLAINVAVVSGPNSWAVTVTHTIGTGAYFDNKGNAGTNLDASRVAGTIVVSSSTPTITGRYRQFFGPTSTTPTTSAEVRAFGSNFTDTNSFNSGTFTLTKFVIAIPATRNLVSVITSSLENITSNFVLATFNVNDGGGVAVSYKVYTFTSVTPLGLTATITLSGT